MMTGVVRCDDGFDNGLNVMRDFCLDLKPIGSKSNLAKNPSLNRSQTLGYIYSD